MPKIQETSIQAIMDTFIKTRSQTEVICAPLQIEDLVIQPITDVSPPKWHLAHTTWFFETFLLKAFVPGYKPFHPMYNYIFNSYYESVGERVMRFDRGHLSRPTVADVMAYRAFVNKAMLELISNLKPEFEADFLKFFIIGINHEQQHQELLVTDIKYILGHNPLFPVYQSGKNTGNLTGSVTKTEFISVKGGVVPVGFVGDAFAWDNEKPEHMVFVPEFEIANRLVTNGDYLEFMHDGGYKKFNFWLGEGWDLAVTEGWEAPMYWHQIDGQWMEYTLNGLQKVDENAPVTHISFFEADAYAAWAGKRLLTEFEWETAARQINPNPQLGNFMDSGILHPIASTLHQEPVKQLLGDTWEWTYSGYFPYPGYKREVGALGEYNGKFMINQMVLRGGSCATPQNHIRISYRNFFQTDKRWQFSGIRLANYYF